MSNQKDGKALFKKYAKSFKKIINSEYEFITPNGFILAINTHNDDCFDNIEKYIDVILAINKLIDSYINLNIEKRICTPRNIMYGLEEQGVDEYDFGESLDASDSTFNHTVFIFVKVEN